MTEFASSLPAQAPANPFDRLCWIMERLLGPGGCPWDREQTHASLRQYLIEEAYEVCDAVETEDFEHLKEELGDVALQVVFHSALAQREKRFGIEEVLEGICAKLIRRHPHVFGQTVAETASQVLVNWEEIKTREKAENQRDESLVAGVPRHLPSLQKAHRLQEKVARVGFDWPDVAGTIGKVREEFEELAHEFEPREENPNRRQRLFEEMGDLLFALVNVSRRMEVQPEEALQAACARFSERFRRIEKRAREKGKALSEMTLEEMDELWEEAKLETEE